MLVKQAVAHAAIDASIGSGPRPRTPLLSRHVVPAVPCLARSAVASLRPACQCCLRGARRRLSEAALAASSARRPEIAIENVLDMAWVEDGARPRSLTMRVPAPFKRGLQPLVALT